MATLTIFSLDEDRIRGEVYYDDVTRRISAVRVINGSNQAVHVTAVRLSDGLAYDHRFAPQSTTFRAIPTNNPGTRLAYFVNADGRLDGISFTYSWPYP